MSNRRAYSSGTGGEPWHAWRRGISRTRLKFDGALKSDLTLCTVASKRVRRNAPIGIRPTTEATRVAPHCASEGNHRSLARARDCRQSPFDTRFTVQIPVRRSHARDPRCPCIGIGEAGPRRDRLGRRASSVRSRTRHASVAAGLQPERTDARVDSPSSCLDGRNRGLRGPAHRSTHARCTGRIARLRASARRR